MDAGVVNQSPSAMEKRHRRARILGWWYVCIGGAFTLLGLRSVVRGDPAWSLVIHFLIAIGFFALSVGTFRDPSRQGTHPKKRGQLEIKLDGLCFCPGWIFVQVGQTEPPHFRALATCG